ncbi:MAG: hypothetical protein WCO82_04310 [Sphingomonadales bacterium]|jgi:hypothetical protein
MRALTIWQPWASLIIIGAKPFEWRRWRAPAWAVDQDIVIHAGSRRVVMDEIEELIFNLEHDPQTSGLDAALALPLLRDVSKGKLTLPTAAGLGTAQLGPARLASEIAASGSLGFIDSDRVDEAVWGWPLTNIQPWAAPMPMKGHQGFWHWPDASTAAAAFIPEEEVPY